MAERPGEDNGIGDAPEVARRRGRDVLKNLAQQV